MSIRAEAKFFEDATKRIWVKKNEIQIGLAYSEEEKFLTVVAQITINNNTGVIPLSDNAYFRLLELIGLSQEKAKASFTKSREDFIKTLNKALQKSNSSGFVFVARQGLCVGVLKNDKKIITLNILVNEILNHCEIVDYTIGNTLQTFHIEKNDNKYLVLNSDCGLLDLTIHKNPIFNEKGDFLQAQKTFVLTNKKNIVGFIKNAFEE